eukprot:9084657-Prorocentrum_lima.AAC.1
MEHTWRARILLQEHVEGDCVQEQFQHQRRAGVRTKTRPDICRAVTRVSRAAKSVESEREVEEKAR